MQAAHDHRFVAEARGIAMDARGRPLSRMGHMEMRHELFPLPPDPTLA